MTALPFPDYTRPDGHMNLASLYPLNGLSPDLGMLKLSCKVPPNNLMLNTLVRP